MTPRRWFLLALAWGAVALLLSAYVHLAYEVRVPITETLRRQFSSAAIFYPLTGIALALQGRSGVRNRRDRGRWLEFTALSLGVGVGFALVVWLMRGSAGASVLSFGVVVGALVLGTVRWIDDRRELARRDREAVELERDLDRARLAVVESQVEPHFLFNTLHAIGLTCVEDPRRARQMIESLADLLRDSLSDDKSGRVSVGEELRRVERYVGLMAFRYDDELDVRIDCAPEAESALVPTFSVQTLVENAMKHAVASAARARRIRVNAERAGDDLLIVVRDDGPGFSGRARATLEASGRGLRGVRERLEAHHGASGSLTLADEPAGGARVELRIGSAWSPGAIS